MKKILDWRLYTYVFGTIIVTLLPLSFLLLGQAFTNSIQGDAVGADIGLGILYIFVNFLISATLLGIGIWWTATQYPQFPKAKSTWLWILQFAPLVSNILITAISSAIALGSFNPDNPTFSPTTSLSFYFLAALGYTLPVIFVLIQLWMAYEQQNLSTKTTQPKVAKPKSK